MSWTAHRRVPAGQALREEADLGRTALIPVRRRRIWCPAIPHEEGMKTCPGVRGATNWYSRGLRAPDQNVLCDGGGKIAASIAASEFRQQPRSHRSRHRAWCARSIETGEVVWEKPMLGPQETDYTGVQPTGGGLLSMVRWSISRRLTPRPARRSTPSAPMTVGRRRHDLHRRWTTIYRGHGRPGPWSFALGYK